VTALRVVAAGPFTTVQDLGRPGRAHLGVPGSGAADRSSLRLANRAVGNPEDAAALEVLIGPVAFEALVPVVICVAGAVCEVLVGDRPQGRNTALALQQGDIVRLGPPSRGLRTYVALRGGIAVPPVLGSRSYDQLSDLGPRPLRDGDTITTDSRYAGAPSWEPLASDDPPASPVLRVTAGPRASWLPSLTSLTATGWVVLPASDRTGIRLTGPALACRAAELPSEGLVPGSIQVPPDGLPILLGPDAGVTGGYPVVAVVVSDDRDLIGQLAPGTTVRFRTTA
jgi:biotin-dependent carboxylase-like uncharacterized protein